MAPRAFLSLVCLLAAGSIQVRGAACPAPASAVCKVSSPTQKEGAAHCGSRGTISATEAKKATVRGPCTASLEDCRDACLANVQCVSFQTTGAGNCVLYSKGVEALDFTSKASSTQRFYNRRCFTFTKGQQCPSEQTGFYLDAIGAAFGSNKYIGVDFPVALGYHAVIGNITLRSTFDLVNKSAATGRSYLMLKGSDPPRYATGLKNNPLGSYVFLATAQEEALVANFAKLECSNGATFTCQVGLSNQFGVEDTTETPGENNLVIYSADDYPDGTPDSTEVMLKAVPSR